LPLLHKEVEGAKEGSKVVGVNGLAGLNDSDVLSGVSDDLEGGDLIII
jgi:hypothetical protein